jgi:hypothetical protein
MSRAVEVTKVVVAVDEESLRAALLKLQQLEREISDLHASTAHDFVPRQAVSHHCANLRHTASKLRIFLQHAVGADAWRKARP